MVQLSITKAREAQLGLDLKCLFRPNANLLISCSLLRSKTSVFQILAPLNLKEPWYLVVLASSRLSMALVIGMEIARMAKFIKYICWSQAMKAH